MNPSTTAGAFGKLAQRLTDHGYRVVPLRGKAAFTDGWVNYALSPRDLQRHSECNVGLLTRTTPALDIDLEHPEARERIEATLQSRFGLTGYPVRVGRAPRFALLFQTNKPFPKIQRSVVSPDGAIEKIEFLGDGQQLAAFGEHPDTGKPYEWLTRNPLAVERDELPLVDEVKARAIVDAVYGLALELGYRPRERAVATTAGSTLLRRAKAVPITHYDSYAQAEAPPALVRALEWLDADDRETWINVGHHLKAGGRPWAFDLWVAWSQTSVKWRNGDSDRWDTFIPTPGKSGLHFIERTLAREQVPQDFPSTEMDERTARLWREHMQKLQRPAAKDDRGLFEWLTDVEPSAPVWLIRGYLERDSVGVLWGEPGSYKSFVAVSWACAIAWGVPWLGHDCHQGDVLIIAGEGRRGLKNRIRAWCLANHVEPAPEGRLGVSKGRIALDDPESVEGVIQAIAKAKKLPVLVIIDTVARNMGGDENSQQDMNAMVAAADRIRHAFPGISVGFVHHANKEGEIRGSTVLRAAVDFEYECKKLAPLHVRLECQKMKEGEAPAPRSLVTKVVDLGIVDDQGDPVTSLAITDGINVQDATQPEDPLKQKIIDAIAKACAAGESPTRTDVYGAVGGRKRDVWALIDALIADGVVVDQGARRGLKLGQNALEGDWLA